jgi:hypothetical protein
VTWERVTGNPASKPLVKLGARRAKHMFQTKVNRDKPEVKLRAKKRKYERLAECNKKKAKSSYGEDCIITEQDVDNETLELKKNRWYQKRVAVSDKIIGCIEKATRLQGQSGVWHSERKVRLTASVVKSVACRKPSLKIKPIVNNLLYGTFRGNSATFNGLMQEKACIKEYKALKEDEEEGIIYEILPCGLVIHKQYMWLGATPDGIVKVSNGDTGLVEVKNVLDRKSVTFSQACKQIKDFCLECLPNGNLQLRRNHAYFYQVQTQMFVSDNTWVDFVVRTTSPHQLHVERIPFDGSFVCQFVGKMKDFYFNVLLPELAVPRHNKDPGIREPGVWVGVVLIGVWVFRRKYVEYLITEC